MVCGNARVFGHARVLNSAKIFGDAEVSGYAVISGNAQVLGDALIFSDAWVSDYAKVFGYARVCSDARISENAEIGGVGDYWCMTGLEYSVTYTRSDDCLTIGCERKTVTEWLARAASSQDGRAKHLRALLLVIFNATAVAGEVR
jgi:hypothetical protein